MMRTRRLRHSYGTRSRKYVPALIQRVVYGQHGAALYFALYKHNSPAYAADQSVLYGIIVLLRSGAREKLTYNNSAFAYFIVKLCIFFWIYNVHSAGYDG